MGHSYVIIILLGVGLFFGTDSAFADITIEPLAGSAGLNICAGTTGVECFIPSTARVEVGGKVMFANTDSENHTFTSGTISDDIVGTVFDSGLLWPGETAYWEPDTAGEFPYFCLLHPWMNGLIIVSGGVTQPPTYDTTPPKILKPTDITVDAENSNGARVTFEVIAIDNIDQLIRPTCNPSSGAIFSVGTTTVTCNARDSAGNRAPSISFSVTVIPPKVAIPDWIKTIASVWCDDKIADSEFISAIQYLIENNIITISETSSGYGSSQEIPNWVKNNACWWSQDLITGEDFASGIEYLIQKGIIRV